MPELAAMLAKINIELTASVYLGVKIDSTYESYNNGLKKEVFIKYADGSLFETEIAPLHCYLPDYTNPKTRAWWINKIKWLPVNGIHGYWNDMNEPGFAAITGRQINLQNRHIGLIDMFNNLGELYDKEYLQTLKEGEVVGIQKTGIIDISENEIEIAF